MDGLAERYNNEGDVDERGASVRNGVERRAETTVGQAKCGETWMTWNDFQDSQKLQFKDP